MHCHATKNLQSENWTETKHCHCRLLPKYVKYMFIENFHIKDLLKFTNIIYYITDYIYSDIFFFLSDQKTFIDDKNVINCQQAFCQ